MNDFSPINLFNIHQCLLHIIHICSTRKLDIFIGKHYKNIFEGHLKVPFLLDTPPLPFGRSGALGEKYLFLEAKPDDLDVETASQLDPCYRCEHNRPISDKSSNDKLD